MPLVSVIVPNYNHAPYLRQRLDSIFNQTFHDFEVIILDDCSTDNSIEIIEEYMSEDTLGYIPSETEVNDFIWFNLSDIMHLYDEDDDEEKDDEEYEDEEE